MDIKSTRVLATVAASNEIELLCVCMCMSVCICLRVHVFMCVLGVVLHFKGMN